MMRSDGSWAVLCSLACLAWAVPAWSEDPGARALQRSQQMRQQQQDELQLRMQQHQRSSQTPSVDSRRQQSIQQLQMEQRQRQQELHYRQSTNAPPASPMDDAGAGHAKSQMEQQRAEEAGRGQLQRFDRELGEGLKRSDRKSGEKPIQ